MPPAFDDTVDHVALGQPHSLVSAFIVHSEHLTTGAHEADGDPLDDYTEGRVLDKVGSQASKRPVHGSCRISLAELAKRRLRDEVDVGLKQSETRRLRFQARTHDVEQLRGLRVDGL